VYLPSKPPFRRQTPEVFEQMWNRVSGFSPSIHQKRKASIALEEQTGQLLAELKAALGCLLRSGNVRTRRCIVLRSGELPIEDSDQLRKIILQRRRRRARVDMAYTLGRHSIHHTSLRHTMSCSGTASHNGKELGRLALTYIERPGSTASREVRSLAET